MRLLSLLKQFTSDDKLLEFLGLVIVNYELEGKGEDRFKWLYQLVSESYYKRNEGRDI